MNRPSKLNWMGQLYLLSHKTKFNDSKLWVIWCRLRRRLSICHVVLSYVFVYINVSLSCFHICIHLASTDQQEIMLQNIQEQGSLLNGESKACIIFFWFFIYLFLYVMIIFKTKKTNLCVLLECDWIWRRRIFECFLAQLTKSK